MNSDCVTKARKEELDSFYEMGVYVYVKREVAKADSNGKIIGVRWVDILKNDSVKSRLVAQEFAGKCDRDDLFASTPPLAATKLLLSQFCSTSKYGYGTNRLMVLDVKRAFFYTET